MALSTKATAITSVTQIANSPHYAEIYNKCFNGNGSAFTASIVELVTNEAQLQTCDQKLVVAEATKAAVMQLPISKALGYAYLLTFKDRKTNMSVPTLIISARGWVQLAQRTGLYQTINHGVVYEGELKSYDKLSGDFDLSGERTSDKVVGFFAYFRLKNGFSKTLYMTVKEMCHHAKTYSPTLKSRDSLSEKDLSELMQRVAREGAVSGVVGWKGNPIAMGEKTILKSLIYKFGPVTIEMQRAVRYDDDTSFGTQETEEQQYDEAVDVTDIGSPETESPVEAADTAEEDAQECPV